MSQAPTELPHRQPIQQLSASGKPRLVSLDVFRGLVILAMLIVNNLGDSGSAGYFWKHADWREGFFIPALKQYWLSLGAPGTPWHAFFTQFPLWRHCTLADFVMPMFMLIIGLSIPFSSRSRGAERSGFPWLRVLRRAGALVLLGWILCYFRDQFAPQIYGEKPFHVLLGMDVLQLLGVSYLAARILHECPSGYRAAVAAGLLVTHWAFLRFWPQGDMPAGTFTQQHNAAAYVYNTWPIWRFDLFGWLSVSFVGLISAIPATGMMLIGTLAGEVLRDRTIDDRRRAKKLAIAGATLAALGVAWSLDLPMNKPRWTPCYLVYCAGVGIAVLALLHGLIEIKGSRRWTPAFVALGVNAIAAYFVTILFKVLFLNTPRVVYEGQTVSLGSAILGWLKQAAGSDWAGGWAFTGMFVAFWWGIFWLCYRKGLVWKV